MSGAKPYLESRAESRNAFSTVRVSIIIWLLIFLAITRFRRIDPERTRFTGVCHPPLSIRATYMLEFEELTE